MENVYTCTCGNQTWIISNTGVRCTACKEEFVTQVTPVKEFNSKVAEEVAELEESL